MDPCVPSSALPRAEPSRDRRDRHRRARDAHRMVVHGDREARRAAAASVRCPRERAGPACGARDRHRAPVVVLIPIRGRGPRDGRRGRVRVRLTALSRAGSPARHLRGARARRRRRSLPFRRARRHDRRHRVRRPRDAGRRAHSPASSLARLRDPTHALGPRVVRTVRGIPRAARPDGVAPSGYPRAGSRLPVIHVRRPDHRDPGLSRETPRRSRASRSARRCRSPPRWSLARPR